MLHWLDMPKLTTYRLHASGLRRVLGDLEADIMERLWARGNATIGEIHHDLERERQIAFNTVMTVMNRLVDKGLLTRSRRGRRYRYAPSQDRDALMASVSRSLAQGLVRDFSEYAVAQFASALAEEDPDKLDDLERLISLWKAERD